MSYQLVKLLLIAQSGLCVHVLVVSGGGEGAWDGKGSRGACVGSTGLSSMALGML